MKKLLLVSLIFLSCGKQPEEISPIKNSIDMEAVQGENDKNDGEEVVNSGSNDFTGVDYQGNQRSCEDKYGKVNCTAMFTESDAFANECKDNGNKAVMCACHDWICVTN